MFVKNDKRSATLRARRIAQTAAGIVHTVVVVVAIVIHRGLGASAPWNSAAKTAHRILMKDLIHISHGRSHRRNLFLIRNMFWKLEDKNLK